MTRRPEKDGNATQAAAADSAGQTEPSPSVPGERRAPYRPRFTPLWNNAISITGLFLMAVALLLMLTFGLFSLVTPTANPYVDIFGYLILPGILVVGAALVPSGILFKSWRVRRRDPAQRLAFRFPKIDLNDPAQRRAAKIFGGCTFLMLPVIGVSSYHGYHYTDSTEFCGKVCHTVMEPQATAYEYSSHARVSCAECHIGSGASWFVKAKLSGTRQVLAMWRQSYARPIAPAIHHLRPARETCERCHWPKKFFGAQLREIAHFSSDEANTRREIDMLLNIGGGDETTGRKEGIHLHMALAGKIEYIATDEALQTIPWVKYTDQTGDTWIFRSDGRPSSDPPPDGSVRKLDCMDCHNRPAHKFRTPQDSVDTYLDVGRIDTTLPYIKREAVKALIEPYADAEVAATRIGNHLTEFYRTTYPRVWDTDKASVNHAVDQVREIYRRTFFPDMKVDWRTYPDNIGHLNSAGCFRCHEGKHVDQRGRRISHDCNLCHTFLNPVERNGDGAVIRKGEFVHPYTLEGPHLTLRCDECHTGGTAPSPTCAGCHNAADAFRRGELIGFTQAELPPDPMLDAVDCEGCHDLSEPVTLEAIDATCIDCHEDEEERFTGMLASWRREVDGLLTETEPSLDGAGRAVLAALRSAGPMHNIEATRAICRELSAAAAGGRDKP